MDLHEAVAAFRKLGYVSIGKGPKHPEGDPEKQQEIDDFFEEYPAIARDRSFVSFLEFYSAAALAWPDYQLAIDIFGFSTDLTLNIARPEELLLDDEGFYRFAEINVRPGPNGERMISGLYAFDATNKRLCGVYQKVRVASAALVHTNYEWCCDSFLEWLSRVVEVGGRLPLVSYNP